MTAFFIGSAIGFLSLVLAAVFYLSAIYQAPMLFWGVMLIYTIALCLVLVGAIVLFL